MGEINVSAAILGTPGLMIPIRALVRVRIGLPMCKNHRCLRHTGEPRSFALRLRLYCACIARIGMYWYVLACIGMYWRVFSSNDMFWRVLPNREIWEFLAS